MNIRFAKSPTGELRFSKPVKPDPFSGIEQINKDITCTQILPETGLNILGDYAFYNNISPFINQVVFTIGNYIWGYAQGGQEDCLFLDVYVPGKIIRKESNVKVPVVTWITGGAFLLGSKTFGGLYSGSHLIDEAKGNMIFVSINYRLGALGWIAGPSVEKEGATNLGLWDQRFAFEWIQENIHLFGGDKNQVNAWGESAGASSILHHLIAAGGTQDPLFKRAILMSPAFQPLGDRLLNGSQENVYKKFEKYAGCENKGFACLKAAPLSAINKANQRIQDEAPRGSFAVGPANDGRWSRQFAAAELKEKNVFKGIESLIVSTTSRESVIFVDGSIKTDADFDKFVVNLFGEIATSTGFVDQVAKVYPRVGDGKGKYANATARTRDFIRDAAFTCNARYVNQAYEGKTWAMEYAEGPGWHGMDMISLYLRANVKLGGRTIPLTSEAGPLGRTYQSYWISHALTGNPNTLALKGNSKDWVPAVQWNKAPTFMGEDMGNVLKVRDGKFFMDKSAVVPKTNCDFLQDFQLDVAKKLGLYPGPPGSPVVNAQRSLREISRMTDLHIEELD
jgi:carboxylesterase type B